MAAALVGVLTNFHGPQNTFAVDNTFAGLPRIVDGDTLVVGDQRVRLKGIDAFEVKQECRNSHGESYLCGIRARQEITNLVNGRQVSCIGKAKDIYGRTVATCTLPSGEDIALRMVENGWALAYRQYGKEYIQPEVEAQLNKR